MIIYVFEFKKQCLFFIWSQYSYSAVFKYELPSFTSLKYNSPMVQKLTSVFNAPLSFRTQLVLKK